MPPLIRINDTDQGDVSIMSESRTWSTKGGPVLCVGKRTSYRVKYLPSQANPFGTVSNRWAFSKSPKGLGTNASTLPKVIRLMVDAPDGRIFLSPDLPQADARIVAWDAQCIPMIQALSDPKRHIHLENCKRLFGREIIKDTEEYTQGKAMLHAANYRMAPKRLAVELGLPVARAKLLLARYFQLYPEIPLWHNTIKERIRTLGFLETPQPFNRRRLFYAAWAELLNTGEISTESWNSACSWIPQSAVADIVNWGLRRLKEKLGDLVWCHKHDHDSYLISVPWEALGQVIPLALELLRVTLTLHNRPLLMEPDMSIGYNYGLMVAWHGEEKLPKAQWWEQVKGRMDEEKIRKDLYGFI